MGTPPPSMGGWEGMGCVRKQLYRHSDPIPTPTPLEEEGILQQLKIVHRHIKVII